jgi:hypothetical protein
VCVCVCVYFLKKLFIWFMLRNVVFFMDSLASAEKIELMTC